MCEKNFGEILREWENEKRKRKHNVRNELKRWIEKYPPDFSKKIETENEGTNFARERNRIRKMEPERVLDLHGLTREEARREVEKFIVRCSREGVKKVLIVHGKGHHSKEGPILAKVVRKELEKNPFAGEMGYADRKHGGKGALWVIIR